MYPFQWLRLLFTRLTLIPLASDYDSNTVYSFVEVLILLLQSLLVGAFHVGIDYSSKVTTLAYKSSLKIGLPTRPRGLASSNSFRCGMPRARTPPALILSGCCTTVCASGYCYSDRPLPHTFLRYGGSALYHLPAVTLGEERHPELISCLACSFGHSTQTTTSHRCP